MKDKNNTSISLNADNAFVNSQNPFMERTINKPSIESLYFNMLKVIHDKSQLV
jgi:hypothetical protein